MNRSQQIYIAAVVLLMMMMTTSQAFALVVPWGSSSSSSTGSSRTMSISISRQQRPFFSSTPVVFMSETTDETATTDASAAAPPPAADVEIPAVQASVDSNNEMEMTPEESAAKRKVVQRERNTLFVGNLPFDVTEAQIKEMFEPHGKVDLVNIPRDRMTQKPRGFAFVDMSTTEELEAAINAVDGSPLENRSVRVMKSINKEDITSERKPRRERSDSSSPSPNQPPKGTKKIYMGNIPFSVTKDEITEFFAEHGEVIDVYIPPNPETGTGRGFAFVTMKEEDYAKAIENTNGATFGGRTLVVNEPLPPGKKAPTRNVSKGTKMYVGNLSFYTVVQTLYDIFGEFGEVLDCYLPEDASTGGSRGFGFVTMSPDDALRAIKEIDGCEVDGRVIRVNEAQPKGRVNNDDNGRNSNSSNDEFGVMSDSWSDMDDQ